MTDGKKTRAQVTIHGQQYTISGTETIEHMRQVAAIVDGKMRGIRSANPNLNAEKLAVLTAVNTVHEYMKLQEQCEMLKREIERLKD